MLCYEGRTSKLALTMEITTDFNGNITLRTEDEFRLAEIAERIIDELRKSSCIRDIYAHAAEYVSDDDIIATLHNRGCDTSGINMQQRIIESEDGDDMVALDSDDKGIE